MKIRRDGGPPSLFCCRTFPYYDLLISLRFRLATLLHYMKNPVLQVGHHHIRPEIGVPVEVSGKTMVGSQE
jgi:hypothetical protein